MASDATASTGGKGMGHVIKHMVLDCDVDKDAVLAQIVEEVQLNDWEEGGIYHGDLTWHDGRVYASREDAERALERICDRPYKDAAVLFRDLETVRDTKEVSELRERFARIRREREDYARAHSVSARKSKSVTCGRCGSTLTIAFMRSGNRCPVCGNDLRAPSTIARIASIDERARKIERRILELKARGAEGAEVRWLLKYEYHV